MILSLNLNDNGSNSNRKNAIVKAITIRTINSTENGQYHCMIIPTMNGNNNRTKGAGFQMGMK